MIKAVFFDLDGTLVDTDKPIVRAVQLAFTAAGLPKPTAKQTLKFSGYSTINWIDCLLRELQLNHDPHPLAESMHSILKSDLEKHGSPMAGARKTLNALKKRGLRLFVVSNASEAYLPAGLQRLKLFNYFEDVIGLEKLIVPKPNSISLINLISKLGLKPAECIYVGDTEVDVQYVKGVGNGITLALLKNSRNRDVKADHYLAKFSDLLNVVPQPHATTN